MRKKKLPLSAHSALVRSAPREGEQAQAVTLPTLKFMQRPLPADDDQPVAISTEEELCRLT
jgi:hypothetical protein